jgi:hypothetical protein
MKYKATIKREQSHARAWTLPSVSSFDVVKLLRFSLLSMLVMLFGGLTHAADPLTIDFESDAASYSDWTFTTIVSNYSNSGVTAHGGSKYGCTDGKASGSIVTKEAIANPGVLTFFVSKESNNTTASTWYVKVSSDGATWSVVGDGQSASSMAKGTWVEVSKDLSSYSNVYVGIFYDGTTAKRDIDDITLAMANVSDTRTATSITLDKSAITTGVGDIVALPSARLEPAGIADAVITWESSDETVAKFEVDEALMKVLKTLKAGTATITAKYAGNDTYKPCEKSFTLTVKEYAQYTTIADMLENITSTKKDVKYTFTGITVTYVNGLYTYIHKIGDGDMLLYGVESGMQEGARYNGSLVGQLYSYNGLPEIKIAAASDINVVKQEGEEMVDIAIITLDKLQNYINKRCTIQNAEFVSASDKTLTFKVGETTFTAYNNFGLAIDALVAGKKYTVEGMGAVYSKNEDTTYQLYPTNFMLEKEAGFVDIKADFTNQSFFTEADANGATAGLKMNEDGTFTRVAADDATANAVISGKWHSKEHGISNFSATVKVEGPVKIILGTCAWGGNVTVKNAEGTEVVPSFTTNTGACYHQDMAKNVVAAYYTGEATTLTIAGGSYVPFFAVLKVNPEDIPHTAKVTFALGESGAEGVLPDAIEKNIGEKVKIPANTTLYAEGKTLTTWTDGTNQYKAGDEITLAEDVTLTPVFTANEVSLADRTSAVHLEWPLGVSSGAGKINFQGNKGFIVCQTDVNGKKIDVKMDIDATSGKINNVGRTDQWAQVNAGTKFTIPSCKGAYFTTEAYSDITTTTINGETNYTPGKNIEYTVTSNAETLDIVIGDGSYYSIVKIDLPVVEQEESKFVDIKADFTNQSFFTTADAEMTRAGLKMNQDGTFTRVSVEDETANAIISGKWHSNEHGISNFMAMVDVEGPVKITMGTCAWGGDVTVQTQNGATFTTIGTFNTNTGACYHSDKEKNVVSFYYKEEVATKLRISGGSYVPYFAVEKVDPKDIPSDVKFIFDITESGAEGVAPAEEIAGIGKKYTLPKNFTLYKEGSTLTGWTDGTNTYAPGEEITAPDAESVTLTPVFTANTVSLADRTEPVTLKYNFRRDAGAPTVAYQNATGIWVAQATIGDKVIDVKADFDTNNGGKFANGNWTDWAQLNSGTKWTIPSCKGATVSIEAYNELTTTSIDGQTDYTSGKTINYTVASAAETVDVVIGNDGAYYRYIQVVLPVVESQGGGQKYDNVHAKAEWFMNDTENPGASRSEPDGVFTTVAFDYGDAEITGISNITNENAQKETTGIKFKPSGTTKSLVWSVKPAAGLTFTPTRIAGYVNRCGTDVENGITVSARIGDGEPIILGTWTALRSGKTSSQKPYDATAIYLYTIDLTPDQQSALTSGETLFLESTIGVGATKEGAFGAVVIDGLINGEKADIAMYTLTTASNPAEGGSVSTYPVSEQYEAGSEVTLTATENFGYDFVNWTNAAGDEVSTEAKFKYTVNADETLTANFKAVETYELALTIDGTNPYMVTISPAPTLIDGKMMYEAGTTVELNANQYEGLVTFTNWSDGETAANKIVKMDDNVTLTAVYAQADIIAGWDFYKKGGEGRKADFAAADNDADALSLVNTATGESSGWLDKSTEAAGGYESFKGAAVNWRTGSSNGDVGNWHWQTKINAEAFTNITVQFQMLYNYNAYQKYNAEFSTDGENWTNFGSITMEGAKAPASFNETLPEAANNQKDLFIRMIADKTSNVDGAASANDGNTLAMFFITGTPKLVDDPVAPALVSSVPANGATGASASGKIVLNFDKKVQLVEGTVATLGAMELTPTVSGKVITFEYKGLEYSKEYTFTLPANTVQNLTGATLADAIAINFTTMERPTIEKGLYDEVVSTAEELAAAIKAANERADKTTRYRIFIKKGIYALPSGANKHYTHTNSNTGEVYFNQDRPDPITYVTGGKISFIGEDRDATIITQAAANETFAGQFGTTSIYDGIGNSDVLQLSGDDYYFQDLTIKSGIEDARGRNLAVHDKSKKSIYKNVCLYGYQDTWTSNNDRGLYYFEGGIIRGRTDYICGKGDAYFDQVEFRQIAGGYCAVPSKPANIGWVMKDCVINGDGSGVDGNYTLGRPWGSGTPVAVWIDTKMNVVPSAIGWNEMGTGWPKRFAEYNSTTSTGSVIDLSGRKKTFGDGHVNNPVLTAEEALEYSDKNKMFGDWNPQLMTESAPKVTDVKLVGTILSWTGNSYSLLYAICKNGEVIAYTKDTTFDLSTLSDEAGSRRTGEESVVYSVRAANEMGGLGEAAEAIVSTGIEEIAPATTTADGKVYNLQGVRVDKIQKGLYIINGKKVVVK